MSWRIVVIAAVLLADTVMAFEFDEHKYLSNIALRAAIDLAPPCALRGQSEMFLAADAIKDRRSFGDVVGLADYVRSVDVIFERDGLMDVSLRDYDDLDWNHITGLKRDLLRFLQAAHLNETHFQQASLIAHMNSHAAAVGLARVGHIHRALVIEAYGLHFLEDFHAPGHVASTRTGMVDYVALASHNKYNDAGLAYRYKPSARDLLPIVEYFSLHPAEIQQLRHSGLRLSLRAEDFAALRDYILKQRQVTFVGDSRLSENPSQAAYLAVLAARSLLDVFEASCTDKANASISSFVPSCWVLGRPDAQTVSCADDPVPTDGVVRVASIPYGRYEAAQHRFHRVWFKPWDVNLLSYYTEARFGPSEGRARRGQISVESLLWSGVSARALEQSLGGNTLSNVLTDVNLTIAYGYTHVSGQNTADGLHGRVIVAFPRVA